MMFCLNLCEILTDDWIERKYFEKLFNLLSQEKDLIERISYKIIEFIKLLENYGD